MKIVRIDLFVAVQNLRAHWKDWDVVERAEAIVRLRSAHLSTATLANVVGCSKASIRRLEVVGNLPLLLKDRIRAGEPVWKFVAWARASRLSRTLGNLKKN